MKVSIKNSGTGGIEDAYGKGDTTWAPGRMRDIIIVVAGTALITYLHYKPLLIGFLPHDTMHIIYRRLYYLPIFYAAFRFGIKGGLLTSLTITTLFVPHAVQSMGGLFKGAAVDNFIDLILYNVVALITGSLVEAKRRQVRRYQETLKLNREIEEREAALRRMQAYTDSVISSISSGVISVDRRGNVVTANPEALRLLGRDEAETVAFPLKKIIPAQPAMLSAAELILAGDQARATLETNMSAGGNTMSVAARITPHVSGGETVGIVITLEDLTEVKDLTEQLLRADKLTGLGELVAGVAHEVRNPLGVIRASVQMMEQEMEAEQGCTSSELTQVMIQEIDRLDALITALLDFGRPSESRFQESDLQQTLEEVITLTRQYANQQGVDIVYECAGDLPAIWADENRLKQVFVNLLTNAIQAMPDGGDLKVYSYSETGFVKVSFVDSGMGMSQEAKGKIFDPFFTTRAGGSGLGLSIVHRIIDAHQGFVHVESNPGAGSNFTIGLPLAKRAASRR